MNKLVTLAMLALTAAHLGFAAEHTRVTNPTNLGVELGGRAFLWNVHVDRVFTDDVAAGVGFGTAVLDKLDGSSNGMMGYMIPVYVNIYFARQASSLYVTLGADVVVNAGQVNNSRLNPGVTEFGATALPINFGLGWETRQDSGFLLRIAAYGVYAFRNFMPWAGVSFGYSF